MKIFSGRSNPFFAQSVASCLGNTLGDMEISCFDDGEILVRIKENVRGLHVFVIQSSCPPVNDNYMELFLILDALKRASASEITLVMPYYGYSRQDRKSAPRVPISAKCIADILSITGVHRLLVVDLHSPQIQGFFNIPVDNLFSAPVLAQAWRNLHPKKDLVVVSPDAGGMARARTFAKQMDGVNVAMIDKRRQENNKARALNLVGDVKGKTALILDDMIDTAGTLCEASKKLMEFGAKEIMALTTHPVFSGPAIQRVEESCLKEVLVTDTIPLKKEAKSCKKIRTVSIAPLVAEAIKRISNKQSVSFLFD